MMTNPAVYITGVEDADPVDALMRATDFLVPQDSDESNNLDVPVPGVTSSFASNEDGSSSLSSASSVTTKAQLPDISVTEALAGLKRALRFFEEHNREYTKYVSSY